MFTQEEIRQMCPEDKTRAINHLQQELLQNQLKADTFDQVVEKYEELYAKAQGLAQQVRHMQLKAGEISKQKSPVMFYDLTSRGVGSGCGRH